MTQILIRSGFNRSDTYPWCKWFIKFLTSLVLFQTSSFESNQFAPVSDQFIKLRTGSETYQTSSYSFGLIQAILDRFWTNTIHYGPMFPFFRLVQGILWPVRSFLGRFSNFFDQFTHFFGSVRWLLRPILYFLLCFKTVLEHFLVHLVDLRQNFKFFRSPFHDEYVCY